MNSRNKLMIVSLYCMIFSGLVCVLSAQAVTNYYVDINLGTDSLDKGTSSGTGAWQTLHYAVSQINEILIPDDYILNVAAGTYTEPDEPDEVLKITQPNVSIIGTDGVVIQAIPDNATWYHGFEIEASGVTIKDIELKDFTYEGRAAIRVVSVSNVSIENCKIHTNDIGVGISSGTDVLVRGCEIFGNDDGINVNGAGTEIIKNILYDNSSNNISIYSDAGTISPKIWNNLIYRTTSGTYGIYISAYFATINPQIYHNTVVGVTNGIWLYTDMGATITADIQYNIITTAPTLGSGIYYSDYDLGNFSGTIEYNDVWNCNPNYSGSGVSAGPYDISLDPLFVGATDFHLQNTSPCVNKILAGANDPVIDDLDEETRPQGAGHDMGCYELPEITQVTGDSVIWSYYVGLLVGYDRLVLPDINADGFDELLLYEDYEQLRVISGADGSTELWSYTLSAEPYRDRQGMAVIDDLDGDMLKDIIVITGTSERLQNNGDDAMYAISSAIDASPRVIWGPVGHTGAIDTFGCGLYRPLIIPDVDGDGLNDIFANVSTRLAEVCYSSDAGLLFSGQDGSRIWFFTDANLWDIYGSVGTPDLNEDGTADIVVGGASDPVIGGAQAWKGGGATAERIWSSLTSDNITNPAVVGDLNSDGVPEIGVAKFHTACPGTLEHELKVLDGTSGSVLWEYALGNVASSIENLGDVTADGIDDLVIGTRVLNCNGPDFGVYALEGDPNAGQRLIWSYDMDNKDSYVKVISDINADGKKDVIVAGGHLKILILSGADGSSLFEEGFSAGSGQAQLGEFDGEVGNDILTSVGNIVVALAPTRAAMVNPPDKPSNIEPADEYVFGSTDSIKLRASAFSDPDGHGHSKSEWQVRRADTLDTLEIDYSAISQSDLIQHTITDPLDTGLKYVWQVRYEDATGHKSDWSDETSFKVGDSVPRSLPEIAAGTELTDFGMISIVHWPDDPSPEAVFNIEYDPRYYRIGRYDPIRGQYIEFSDNLEMIPGYAYWILAREGLMVSFKGILVSKVHDIEVCLDYNSSTQNGWSMIAPPNDADYYWGDVKVGRWVEGSPELTVVPMTLSNPDLSVDTLIDRKVWQWENGAYVSYLPADNFLLESYRGYWVKAKLEGVYLVFPQTAQMTNVSKTDNVFMAFSHKVGRWLKNLTPKSNQAIADNDTPPMPMGTFTGSDNENVFEGCFVTIVSD